MLDNRFHIKLNGSSIPKFDTIEPKRIHFIVEILIQEAFINDETAQLIPIYILNDTIENPSGMMPS